LLEVFVAQAAVFVAVLLVQLGLQEQAQPALTSRESVGDLDEYVLVQGSVGASYRFKYYYFFIPNRRVLRPDYVHALLIALKLYHESMST